MAMAREELGSEEGLKYLTATVWGNGSRLAVRIFVRIEIFLWC